MHKKDGGSATRANRGEENTQKCVTLDIFIIIYNCPITHYTLHKQMFITSVMSAARMCCFLNIRLSVIASLHKDPQQMCK